MILPTEAGPLTRALADTVHDRIRDARALLAHATYRRQLAATGAARDWVSALNHLHDALAAFRRAHAKLAMAPPPPAPEPQSAAAAPPAALDYRDNDAARDSWDGTGPYYEVQP